MKKEEARRAVLSEYGQMGEKTPQRSQHEPPLANVSHPGVLADNKSRVKEWLKAHGLSTGYLHREGQRLGDAPVCLLQL
jgi:hypothetical protein